MTGHLSVPKVIKFLDRIYPNWWEGTDLQMLGGTISWENYNNAQTVKEAAAARFKIKEGMALRLMPLLQHMAANVPELLELTGRGPTNTS